MSLAKKCDRCGKLYEYYSLKSFGFNGVVTCAIDRGGRYNECKLYDLCESCRDKLKDFLDNKED